MKIFLILLLATSLGIQSQKYISTTVNFQTNEHHLSSTAKIKLTKTLKNIPTKSIIRIALIGHTDSDGDILYNQKLSERRSQATLDFLLNAGINQNKIESFSKGEVEPRGDNNTKAGKTMNRRVELTIVYRKE